MMEELRIYEVVDETGVFVMGFHKSLKKMWQKECKELQKSLKRKEIIGFVAVDEKGDVKIHGDVTKVMQIMDELGYLQNLKGCYN